MNASAPAPFRAALFWLAAAVIVLFAWAGIYELMAARAAWTAVAGLNLQRDDDERRLAQLKQEAKAAAATAARMEAQAKTVAAAVPQATDQSKAEADAKKAAARALAQAFFAKYPQARGLFVTYMKRNMESYYGPFFRAAGLSQAQIDEFVSRMADLHADTLELSPNGDLNIGQQNLSADEAKSILGEAGYHDWRDARRAMPAEQFAISLATEVNAGAAPLSSDQVMQLTQALTSNSDAYAEGGAATVPSIDWANAMDQAKTLMNDAQWQQAQAYLTLQAANRQLQALMKGAR